MESELEGYVGQKQVIVVRKDLGMRKGKMIAQGAHASVGAIFAQGHFLEERTADGKAIYQIVMDTDMEVWTRGRFKKIAVSVNSEAELLEIHQKALQAGLHTSLIQDAGLTEFGGVATYTTCVVGPNAPDKVDLITGNLSLL